jgi:hypothetical protein
MRRLHSLLIVSLVGGCSFPTQEFTLGGGADVPAVDTPVVDTPAVDAPADTTAVDAPVDSAPDATPVDMTVVDVTPDVTPDVAPDVTPDAGPPDAGPPDAGPCMESFQIRCAARGGTTACINPLNDVNNCGVCGRACAMGQNCQLGGCQFTPTARYGRTNPSAAAVPFINACTTAASRLTFPGPDDASTLVPLPFAFQLFSAQIPVGTMINVSTNGFISLEGAAASIYAGDIPSMVAPNAVIAPYWTDLLVRDPGGVCAVTVGTMLGARKFVVQWNNVVWYTTAPMAPQMNFEVILNEGTNVIEFAYQTIVARPADLMRTLTIGIENAAGLDAFPVCNGAYTPCGIMSGSRVRLTPILTPIL